MSAECGVCGANGPIIVRPGNGHADWCERTRAWLRAEAERKDGYGAVPHGHHRCYPRGCQRPECKAAHLAWRSGRYKALAASPPRRAGNGGGRSRRGSRGRPSPWKGVTMDAIREHLAKALVAAEADNDQLRAQNDDLRRALIHERFERKAEDDRQKSPVRWTCQ